MTLCKLLKPSVSPFPYLENETNNSIYLIGLKGGLSGINGGLCKLIFIRHLKQYLLHDQCSVTYNYILGGIIFVSTAQRAASPFHR